MAQITERGYALRNNAGKRTFLSHTDKQQLRETFAEKLNDLGVEASATLRKTRGLDEQPDRKGVHHRRKEGRDVRIDQTEADNAKRDARRARHRLLIENVFNRSIALLARSPEPEQAAIAKSLSAFISPEPVVSSPADKSGADVVELGGERIDLTKLDAEARKGVLEMVARAKDRDDRTLARRAGVTVNQVGRREVQLGGETIDVDRLDPKTQKTVLEMAAKSRERGARTAGKDAPGWVGPDPVRGSPNDKLSESFMRLKESTNAIERMIRERAKDRKGPDR